MLALKSVKDILVFMGVVVDTDENYSLQYVKNVLITMPLVILLLPLCGYIAFNVHSLLSATDVFYLIAACLQSIGQYWFLVAHKAPLQDLISELQMLIDQSIYIYQNWTFSCYQWIQFTMILFIRLGECESRVFHKFIQAEHQVTFFTKQMKVFVTFCCAFCFSMPYIYVAYRSITGEYKDSDWYLPYKSK